MKWGVAFGWQTLSWEERLALVERAEALGYDAAYVDGDISQLGARHDAEALDGWTVTTALLARTRRIAIGSIRLVHHWHTARLAQVAATAERLAPGRLAFLVSIGDRPEDRAWGLPALPARERIAWLDETLEAVGALWRGETVTRRGEYVRLEGARVRPTPPGGRIPVEIGGKGPALLEVVARHADRWNVNWPPIEARVAESAEALEAACRRIGRAPETIGRRMWIFARTGRLPAAEALAEFRRWNPWFASIADAEVAPSLAVGAPTEVRERLQEWARVLQLEMPVVDLSGLGAEAARETLESLPAGEIR